MHISTGSSVNDSERIANETPALAVRPNAGNAIDAPAKAIAGQDNHLRGLTSTDSASNSNETAENASIGCTIGWRSMGTDSASMKSPRLCGVKSAKVQ